MRCCVIGGAGFIGAYVTRLLAESGRDVLVLGRRDQPAAPLPRGATYLAGDYRDLAVVRQALAGSDAVIDLAYATVPKTSFDDPVFDIVANLPPGVQLLAEAAASRIGRVVLVSSGGTVYGVAQSLPIREDHATNPISPYGITKLTIEKYAGMFAAVSNLPVVIARPGNAYGEGQGAFSGQGFIATAMHSIVQGRPITLFGTGQTVRDYIHVADVASGIVAALDQGVPGQAYNVGTGLGTSILEILGQIEPHAQAAGYSVQTTMLPGRGFDVPANVLDSHKLAEVSGWRPQITLEQGIERAWRSVVSGPSR